MASCYILFVVKSSPPYLKNWRTSINGRIIRDRKILRMRGVTRRELALETAIFVPRMQERKGVEKGENLIFKTLRVSFGSKCE